MLVGNLVSLSSLEWNEFLIKALGHIFQHGWLHWSFMNNSPTHILSYLQRDLQDQLHCPVMYK